jgi:cbb3-type cytochrome oxidase maturation protein
MVGRTRYGCEFPCRGCQFNATDLSTVDILYLLIPLSLVLVVLIGAIFWWALDSGQFDDLDVPGHAVLMDGDAQMPGEGGREKK